MLINPLRSVLLLSVGLGLAGPALAAPAAAPVADPAFEREIGLAKSSMMAAPQKAYQASKAALALAEQAPPGAARDLESITANWLMAEALTRNKHPEQALPILGQALAVVAKVAPDAKLHGDLLKSRGHAFATVGRIQEALQDFQAAYLIYQRAREPRSEAVALQEIGSIYSDARDYPHVLQYYAQARDIFAQDPALTLAADNNRGFALKSLGQLSQAVAELRDAYAVADKLGSGALKADILANIAFTEALEGKNTEAETDAKLGLRLASNDPEAKGEKPFLEGALAKVAANGGDNPGAAHLLDQVFAGVNLGATQMEYKDFHELASNVYEAVGDRDKALQHLKAFKRLDDQGRSLAASTNAALVAAKFDFANQATRIAELKVTQAQSRQRFTLAIIGILLLGGLVVTSLITHAFFTMRRSRNQIRAVNSELGLSNSALEKALKAKTEFLATTSHEIRTPLNGILGMAQVMLADRSLSKEARERLDILKAAGETMNAMVNDLLDVAKIENGALTVEPKEIDLRALLDQTCSIWRDQARSKNLEFKVDLAGCPPRVVEDGDRLRQILHNLMSNAVKFTEFGTVTLSVQSASLEQGERLIIAVTDSGIGIPADQFERIFESFTQVDSSTARKFGGTGLGLTICRNIAAALGGSISVRSEVGAGSTFSLDLPLTRVAQHEAAGEVGGLAGAALLILDDNALAHAMLRAVLAQKTRRLDFIGQFDAAVEAVRSNTFDRVLVDGGWLQRSFAEDVLGAVSTLAQAGAAPVSVLWPGLTPQFAALLQAAGAAQVIAKPIAAAALVKALEDEHGRSSDRHDSTAKDAA